MCCGDFYDVLWCVVDCVGDRVSKRGHFGPVSRPWDEPRTSFEVVVVVFWDFVIAIVFFVSEFLV